MFLFLDDVRDPSSIYPNSVEKWVIARKAEQAMRFLSKGNVEFISFDHDLGTELTGYDVACFIEDLVVVRKIKCPDFAIHSANPVGRNRIWAAMLNTKKIQAELAQLEEATISKVGK